jgi:hypothetical protein
VLKFEISKLRAPLETKRRIGMMTPVTLAVVTAEFWRGGGPLPEQRRLRRKERFQLLKLTYFNLIDITFLQGLNVKYPFFLQ